MPVEIGPISVIEDKPVAVSPMSSLGSVALGVLGTFGDRLATNYANKVTGVNPTPAYQPNPPAPTASPSSVVSISPWLIGGGVAVAVLGLVLILRNR